MGYFEEDLPPRGELERLIYARHAPGVLERARAARVAVAGLGGLGSNVALMLARSGVGHLHLVDFDVVEPSNLNRQQYFLRHLGRPKAEALRELILEINPYLEVVAENVRVTEENAGELFAEDEIVIEAFDRAEAKVMLVEAVREYFPEKTLIAASGMAGLGEANGIRTRRIGEGFFLCGDEMSEGTEGLMAPRVTLCAAHEACAALRAIAGLK